MLKYQKELREYKITSLDNEILAESFRKRAKEFETKIQSNELTDEEISKEDEALVELFNDVHDFVVEDSEDVKKVKLENLLLKAKADISKTDDLDTLEKLKLEYKESDEAVALIDKRIKDIEDYRTAESEVAKANSVKEMEALKQKYTHFPNLNAKIDEKIVAIKTNDAHQAILQEISDASNSSEKLNNLKEKYASQPEILILVNDKIKNLHDKAKMEEDNRKQSLKQKLLSQQEWSYSELKGMGIKPTGDDMFVEGVLLERQYLLNIYKAKPEIKQ